MDYINELFNQVITNFDFSYILIINLLTYFSIKLLDILNKDKCVTTWQKRIILILSIMVITIAYLYVGYENKITLLNSAILTPVFWSWIIKPIFKKFKIDYKHIDNTLK